MCVRDGSGLLSQNSLVAQFGLGSVTTIDSLIVRWPSGTRQVVAPPSVRSLAIVTESYGSGVEDPGVRWETALLGVIPNPFTGTTTIRYSLAVGSVVRLEILDAVGRRVRVVRDGPETVGSQTAVWDGRTDSGEVVGSGTYFLRFLVGEQSWSKSVVLVR